MCMCFIAVGLWTKGTNKFYIGASWVSYDKLIFSNFNISIFFYNFYHISGFITLMPTGKISNSSQYQTKKYLRNFTKTILSLHLVKFYHFICQFDKNVGLVKGKVWNHQGCKVRLDTLAALQCNRNVVFIALEP